MSDKRQTPNQLSLADSVDKFRSRHSYFGDELISFLTRDQSAIAYANIWENPHLAAIRIAPSAAISKQFDIWSEIPVLVADFDGDSPLQPRVIRHLDTSPQLRASSTADKDIAVLVAADERAREFVRDRSRFAFPILVLDANDLAAGKYRERTLRTELSKLLTSVNHFDYSNEISNRADYYGRVAEIDALTKLLMTGQSVGVFGLRRAGKTSLLYQVRDEMRAKGLSVTYLQLNEVDDGDHFREMIVERIARLLIEAKRTIPSGLEMVSPEGRIKTIDNVRRRWIYEADYLLDLVDTDVVLLIDETDQANEEVGDDAGREEATRYDLNRVLQQLRGLIQLRNERGKKRLSFLSAGTAASIYSESIRFGKDNQMFGFATVFPLGPLQRNEMRDMVRSLGKRSGLKFDGHELFNELYEEYGGHPHLTRRACSLVARRVHESEGREVPHRVTLPELRTAFAAPGELSPARAAWETFRSFQRWYPDEAALVTQAVESGRPCDDLAGIGHAIDFGFMSADGLLRMRALRKMADSRD